MVLLAVASEATRGAGATDAPRVPPGLAAVRVFATDATSARRWLAASDEEAPKSSPRTDGADLAGVDEADLVALEVVLTRVPPTQAMRGWRVFEQGHHGYLTLLAKTTVAAFAKAQATEDLRSQVVELATELRGQPKQALQAQLSLDDLRNLRSVCATAGKRSVFVHFSE